MDIWKHLQPDFDYRSAASTALPPDFDYDELPMIKKTAVEKLQQEMPYITHEKLRITVILTSAIRVELPFMYAKHIGLDSDTAFCFTNAVLDEVCLKVAGFAPSWAVELAPAKAKRVPRNWGFLVFNAEFLHVLYAAFVSATEPCVDYMYKEGVDTDEVLDAIPRIVYDLVRKALQESAIEEFYESPTVQRAAEKIGHAKRLQKYSTTPHRP